MIVVNLVTTFLLGQFISHATMVVDIYIYSGPAKSLVSTYCRHRVGQNTHDIAWRLDLVCRLARTSPLLTPFCAPVVRQVYMSLNHSSTLFAVTKHFSIRHDRTWKSTNLQNTTGTLQNAPFLCYHYKKGFVAVIVLGNPCWLLVYISCIRTFLYKYCLISP